MTSLFIGQRILQGLILLTLSALPGATPSALAGGTFQPLHPICDVKSYGAIGDGKTKDTLAMQAAIDRCPIGGVVVLGGHRSYLSGTLRLKSDITFRIESGSKLLGSRDDQDYPDLKTPTQNTQLKQCRKALLYGESLKRVVIEGMGETGPAGGDLTSFGTIDGSGDNHPSWMGPEATRPMALFIALSDQIQIRNLQVVNSGMWSVVNMENTNVLVESVRIDSHWGPTRDGIDIVDSSNVTIKNCDILSEDDSICLKSGSPKGLHHITVQDSVIHNSLVANALKIGTASVGEIEGLLFENIKIEGSKQTAMAVESVDGSPIHDVVFRNIDFANSGTAFFVLLGQRTGSPGVGSIDDLHFEKIRGQTNLDWGSVVSGSVIDSHLYPITRVHFDDVQISSSLGGRVSTSFTAPPEYAGEYPDPRMWSPMPAFGIFLRHVEGLERTATKFQSYPGETRPGFLMSDVGEK